MKKNIFTTVNGTDNNKEILNLSREKFKGTDRDMQQENNGPSSRIDEVKNFFIERRSVDLNHLKKRLVQCLRSF